MLLTALAAYFGVLGATSGAGNFWTISAIALLVESWVVVGVVLFFEALED